MDIEPSTFNISPAAVEAAITPRTRAIIPVDLFGQMAAMEALVPLAARHGLALIEDAAQSIGARRRIDGTWRMAGELATVGTLSFFPSKNLGAFGDGGMMVTQDDALADRLRAASAARRRASDYFHDEVGFNSRLDTLQAAVLLAKLPHLADWSAARARHAARYNDAFPGTRTSARRASIRPTSRFSTSTRSGCRGATRCRPTSRRAASAARSTIRCRFTCSPASPTSGTRRGSLPDSEAASREVISLPVFPELTEAPAAGRHRQPCWGSTHERRARN